MSPAQTPLIPVTATLVERALLLRRQDLPADVVTLTHQCLSDVLAVSIAGHHDELPRRLLADLQDQGVGRAESTLLGSGERLGARQAALVNGCAAHALDFDDVNLSINGHPSAVLAPALLALAETLDASGADLFMAFVAAYEFTCRAGVMVEPGHYARGYHATGSVGVLGAAVGCARLLGLDTVRTSHAVGIAATQAAGLKSMFGTPCKPLHVGLAARNGLEAALWASRGLDSRTDVLECVQGFARTLSPDFFAADAIADPARFYMRDNLFKYHAACYGTHSAIDCALQLRQQHAMAPDDIESIVIRVATVADSTCNIADPQTAAQSKFSLRFATALALLGLDTADLDNFGERCISMPPLQRLRALTTVQLMPDWATMQTEVEVKWRGGGHATARADTGVAETDIARQGQRLMTKFDSLVSPVLGIAGTLELAAALDALETTSVRQLMALCQSQEVQP